MSLTLHYHPLSSYCWKVLLGLYEKDLPFDRVIVDLGDEQSRAAFYALWPMGKMAALVDGEAVVVESSIILEHLDVFHPGPRLIPTVAAAALRVRFWDRFFDLYVHDPMQRIVADRIRKFQDLAQDPVGVAENRRKLRQAYDYLEKQLGAGTWMFGDDFSLADCAAAPALYYADRVEPFAQTHPRLQRYKSALMQRPSMRRVYEEAEPYLHMFPEA